MSCHSGKPKKEITGNTIDEIASLAKVSKTTVSLVLNGRASEYRISAKTQERIQNIIREKNFVPDPYARGFRLKRTQTLGLVVPDLANWFFSEISQATEQLARNRGRQVFISFSNDNEETEFDVIQNLCARRIDGLIVASVMKTDSISQAIKKYKIPMVYIDRQIETRGVSWVASDNFLGAYDLIRHMCSKNIREIYYLGGLKNISTSKNRLRGYRKALEDSGIPYDPRLVLQDDYTIAAGYRLAQKMYRRRKGMPQAFFTASLTLLEGALQFVRETFGRIPDSLQIGTFDDHPFLDYLSIKIASVRQNTGDMVKAAFEMLDDAMDGKGDAQNRIVKPELVLRS